MAKFRYFLIHKPYKVLSQFTSPVEGKLNLGDVFDLPKDVYPVGRLDEDSEGLLLLTNDPSLNQQLLGTGTEKEYYVQVEGIPDEAALDQLRKGVEIRIRKKPYITRPARVERLESVDLPDRDPPIRYRKSVPDSWLSITLTEGKNRQIRRMTAKTGFPTLRLIRMRIGKWELGDLKAGEFIEIEV